MYIIQIYILLKLFRQTRKLFHVFIDITKMNKLILLIRRLTPPLFCDYIPRRDERWKSAFRTGEQIKTYSQCVR